MSRRRTRVSTALAAAAALVAVATMVAPPSYAAPSLEVSTTSGLKTGQSITIVGTGFAPNLKGIAIGQCRVGYTGPSDCNLAGGATFRNADESGSVGTITIKVAESFGGIDCTQEACVIAASPLPTTSPPEEVAANTVTVPISFGDAPPAAPAPAETAAPAAPVAAAATVDLAPVSAAEPLGADDDSGSGVLTALIVSNVLLIGVGLYLGLSRRRLGGVR